MQNNAIQCSSDFYETLLNELKQYDSEEMLCGGGGGGGGI